MTERKPPGLSMESWVDRQIREAEERGVFDNLPGAGKPLRGMDQPYDETWWLKDKLRREGLSFLPPGLALRKEAEDTLDLASRARSEAEVRRLLAEVNQKIAEAIRKPQTGPVAALKLVDVEAFVSEWRDQRE